MNWPWIGLLLVVSALTATGHVLFKMAAVGERRLRDRLLDARFLAGCAAFGLGPVLTYLAARHVDFSIIYAITALNFPLVLILARLVLGEGVDRTKLLGVVGIMVGLAVFLFF